VADKAIREAILRVLFSGGENANNEKKNFHFTALALEAYERTVTSLYCILNEVFYALVDQRRRFMALAKLL
jgi:hypothetical protein